jgi:hypothetical protein
VTFCIAQTMASSGLVMTMTKASGQCCLIASPTVLTMPALVAIRSSRLMPGFRGMPAVTITTSAPAMAA